MGFNGCLENTSEGLVAVYRTASKFSSRSSTSAMPRGLIRYSLSRKHDWSGKVTSDMSSLSPAEYFSQWRWLTADVQMVPISGLRCGVSTFLMAASIQMCGMSRPMLFLRKLHCWQQWDAWSAQQISGDEHRGYSTEYVPIFWGDTSSTPDCNIVNCT